MGRFQRRLVASQRGCDRAIQVPYCVHGPRIDLHDARTVVPKLVGHDAGESRLACATCAD
jgi:hypothetical protein